jgi:hypothetical protein
MVSFNGEAYDVCGTGDELKLCPWATFQTKMRGLFPAKSDCPEFYENYHDRSPSFREEARQARSHPKQL